MVAGSGSGIQRLVATPPVASFTGDHTHAQHAKELDDGEAQNDKHGVTQDVLQELIQLPLTALCVQQVWLVHSACALRCSVFTAGQRHGVVVAVRPGGVGPAGVIHDTTALQLSLQVVNSFGLSSLSIIMHEDFTHRALQVCVYLAFVDKAKHQSSHFSGKDRHDDQKKKAESDFGLPECSAASNQAKNKHHHADADDNSGWDQRVLVLDETAKVVIALDYIGSDVGQYRSCSPEYQAEEEQDGLGGEDPAVHVERRRCRE